jgi:hypothetical protein
MLHASQDTRYNRQKTRSVLGSHNPSRSCETPLYEASILNPKGLFKMLRCPIFLAFLPQAAFAGYMRVTLDENRLRNCLDTTASFNLDESVEERDCEWLSNNLDDHEDLCDLHEVSSLCRVTCGVCEVTLVAVDLLKTCSDGVEPVTIPGRDAPVSCDWLRENKSEYGDACLLTGPALQCPSACGTFGLCTDDQDQNA